MKRAVVLLSGGLDSAVTAYIAREDIGKKGELFALTFDYGQEHGRELSSARNIARELGVKDHLGRWEVSIPCESALTPIVIGMRSHPEKEIRVSGVKEEIPSTWVPQRNSIFLALAFAYAETVGASYVYAGYNVRDYSGYPDCRPEFVEAVNKALNLASKKFIVTGKGIGIVTPLMYLTKADIVRKGMELGVDFSLTTSCYLGGVKACGVCDSCRIRLAAFKVVGISDPVEYDQD